MKAGYYNLQFIPNKLVYVYATTNTDILFLAFFKLNGLDFKAHKHSISKKQSKEFKKVRYNPIESIKILVNDTLQTV